ncbi:MAG TPA: hypothetical protein VER36_07880 [Flavisolibacter sp.]|nr:hypothetical protein [Flavisolibacter sp.]
MSEQNQHLEALQDIRQMMQRSSRFISLSGLSGIAAGIWALIGTYIGYNWIREFYNTHSLYSGPAYERLVLNMFLLACAVLCLAVVSAFYFTWRKIKEDKVPLWNYTSRQLTINVMIPLIAGGVFVLSMLQHGDWRFVAPATLIFYGLALVNGSKYTLSDVRYLGICEIILGLIATQFIGYGLYFWAVGFGVLHIIYGFIMWWKNERKPAMA